MDRTSKKAAWKILDLVEDYVSGGFIRRDRPDLLESDSPARSDSTTAPKTAEPVMADGIAAVSREVKECSRCGLSLNRRKPVPGEGDVHPLALIVGEGPGEREDAAGRPFVDNSGEYLDKWLKSIGLDRARCFITNCVKCRPPENREPHPDEIKACLPFLERQILALKPKTILCLGRISAQTLLETASALTGLRGRVHDRRGIPLVVTYHPNAVLRDQNLRRPVWEDLNVLKTLL